MCLEYVQCFIALKELTDLVLARSGFPRKCQVNHVEVVHAGGARQGWGGCAAQKVSGKKAGCSARESARELQVYCVSQKNTFFLLFL